MEELLDQTEPEQPQNKNVGGKILGWNLGIMLGYMSLSTFAGDNGILTFDLIGMVLQVALNFLLAITFSVYRRWRLVPFFLLSMMLVVIVGFGVCAAKVQISDYTRSKPLSTL